MRTLLGIARTGVVAALGHPLRSAVTVGCLVAVLLPFVAGLGVSRGLRDQADDSIRFGADLYVSGKRLGRDAGVPLSVARELRTLPGVTDVVPRIVGEVRLGTDAVSAVVVGLPPDRLPRSSGIIDGRLFTAGSQGELVVGSQLARRLHLRVGDRIPPFYRNDAGERVSTVVGIFHDDVPIWEANLVFTSFETASMIFAQQGLASSLLVSTTPDARDAVRTAITRMSSLGDPDAFGPLLPRVTSREDLEGVLSRGLLHREGVFNLHFLLAFALGIPLVLLTTGVGLAERRRETGLLKAMGWQTDEILVRSLAESVLLSAMGASIAILLAWLWLGWFGGVGVASVFVSGVDAAPGVELPFRLTPVPALLCFILSFVVVVTGSALSSWRAATTSPAEAMR